jgi:hypothetical protein
MAFAFELTFPNQISAAVDGRARKTREKQSGEG